MKKSISFLICIAILLPLCACSGGKKSYELSPEKTSVTTDNGISVELGDYVLDSAEKLTIETRPVEENRDEGYQIESYDFSLGELTELDDYIIIRIPYDTGYVDEGSDPAKCVGAKYYNESTGEWEDLLYTVDETNSQLVIYTNHLSVYGAFYVKNEGKRSAYISNVFADLSNLSMDQATAALTEFVSNGGSSGEAVKMAGASVASSIFAGSGSTADAVTAANSVMNIATLGDPVFDSALGDKAFKALGDLGRAATIVKIGSAFFNDKLSKGEILGLYKDASDLMIDAVGGAALGVAMSGVWIFNQVVNEMFSEGMEIKLENIGMVYQHYNEEYSPRSLKQWRRIMIDLVEKNKGNQQEFQKQLDKEIDNFCNRFWNLSTDEQSLVAGDIQGVDYKRMSYPTSSEIETLTAQYKKQLYEDLYPVSVSVKNYMLQKTQSEYLKALESLKSFYNQRISFKISEDVKDGATPQYGGYTVRFAPLSESAVKSNWTGVLNSSASISTQFTLLGFILAGSPNQIELFKAGSDPETSTADLTVPFKLTAPSTEVKIGGAPSFDELVGAYEDGTITITDYFVSDSLKAELASSQGGSSSASSLEDISEGCDPTPLILSITEYVGVTREAPFTIVKTEENAGYMLMNENGSIDLSYDSSSGVLTMSYSKEGATVNGTLNCAYNADKTGVSILGSGKMSITYPESDFYLIVEFKGTKALTTGAA